MAQIKIQDYI